MAKKPQVQRRRKTARAAIRKGATLMETPGEPRVAWAGRRPRIKKR